MAQISHLHLILRTHLDHGQLHHGYCLGDHAIVDVRQFIEQDLRLPLQGNPDFSLYEKEILGITESRELQERHILTPSVHARKIFFIITRGITIEAQNALLKVFEEPVAHTHFFLFMPQAAIGSLLPTLRSRLQIIDDAQDNDATTGGVAATLDLAAARAFLAASPAKRLAIVAPLIEKKDRQAARAFCDALEVVLVESSSWAKGVKGNAQDRTKNSATPIAFTALSDLLLMKSYLADRSSSLKLILEHIALTV